MSQPKRYRPVFKGKDAEMRFDESGDWTSLACYYLLHDKVARLGADLTQMTAWGRGLETELRLAKEANAALKAETVKRLEETIPPVETYIGKLEAELERLTKERDHYQWASTNDGIACNERARENQELENQIDELKAQNERLRKAGDEMEKWIKGFNQPHISAFEWHIAKVVQS